MREIALHILCGAFYISNKSDRLIVISAGRYNFITQKRGWDMNPGLVVFSIQKNKKLRDVIQV